MKWIVLALGILCNAGASLLVKRAVEPPYKFPPVNAPWLAVQNWPLLLGLTLYGAAFVVYSLALTRLPVNVAHPILTAGAVACVAIGSALFFHESFRISTLAGLILVAAGVALIAQKAT